MDSALLQRALHHRFLGASMLILMLCLSVALSPASVASQPAHAVPVAGSDALQQGDRQLAEGRTTLDPQTLGAARAAFAECLRINPGDAQCSYSLARSEYYLVQAESIAGHSDASRRWLDAAIADAQKTIAVNDTSADAHALLADLYGQKITGALSGMRYGPKSNSERARAFQLDPNCAFAFAAEGRKDFYAPSMFGGDLDKAIASFKRATELDPRSDEAFVWLAIAYRKKGDTAREQQALAEALRLNSRSVFARRVQSGQQ